MITTRFKPGTDDQVADLLARLRAIEQPDSGLVRTTAFRDQADPDVLRLLVVFESEEHARAREQDARRTEGLQAAQAIMNEILAGPPEFTDMIVVEETTW
jgi:quinol monooxygenase YgiN